MNTLALHGLRSRIDHTIERWLNRTREAPRTGLAHLPRSKPLTAAQAHAAMRQWR